MSSAIKKYQIKNFYKISIIDPKLWSKKLCNNQDKILRAKTKRNKKTDGRKVNFRALKVWAAK